MVNLIIPPFLYLFTSCHILCLVTLSFLCSLCSLPSHVIYTISSSVSFFQTPLSFALKYFSCTIIEFCDCLYCLLYHFFHSVIFSIILCLSQCLSCTIRIGL